jgi:hypothetical protein
MKGRDVLEKERLRDKLWEVAKKLRPSSEAREIREVAQRVHAVVAAQQKRIEELEKERESLHGELARLLGPRQPREGVTANDHWIAAVAKLICEWERDVERVAEAREVMGGSLGPETAL